MNKHTRAHTRARSQTTSHNYYLNSHCPQHEMHLGVGEVSSDLRRHANKCTVGHNSNDTHGFKGKLKTKGKSKNKQIVWQCSKLFDSIIAFLFLQGTTKVTKDILNPILDYSLKK